MLSKKIKSIVAGLLVMIFITPSINVNAIPNKEDKLIEQGENSNDSSITNSNDESSKKEQALKKESLTKDNLDENERNGILNEGNTEEEVVSSESINTNRKEINLSGKKYKKTKMMNSNLKNYSLPIEEGLEREEFKLKKEALENLEVLEPMTEKPYELTVANSDGSYEFIEGYNTLDEAINAAKRLDESKSENQEMAVINDLGRVVYSINQMARIIKYVNNNLVSGNVNIYTNSKLDDAFTYVNTAYMDDAPVLEVNGGSAKIMINGYEGWINNNSLSGTYDMIVVPLNTVKNPSYYTVKNGELVHFISYDLTGNTGYNKILGKAPSFLKEGERYLSYDGKYFYSYNHNVQSDIANKLNIVIDDYKSGNRKNAINNGSPYFTYYLNLPFRSQTIYSANDLNKYINEKTNSNSKLRGLGQAFKDAEASYGVNALLALGVSINESAFGMSSIAQNKNNLFGLKAYDSSPGESADSFASPTDSVIDFTKNWISRGYADPADWRYFGGFLGNKERGANVKYASDPYWGEKAASFAYDIDKHLSGGNSNLKDTNSKQVGVATSDNLVIKKDGTLLYNVTNDTKQYGGYINTPFVISNLNQVNINGKNYYEIHPERNTPVGAGGAGNKYSGNYNWSDMGYIEARNVNFVNEYLPPVDIKYGINRYSTSVELSKSQFNSAETIVITNGYAIPDGLTATPIASYHNGPLLLVEEYSIPNETKNEIKRLNAKNVIIVGGTSVVSPQVENQLRNLGISKITRLGGLTRYETALQVAKYIDSNLYDVKDVFIANGYGEADALSIAPVSGRDKMPIILVDQNDIKSDIKNWLRSEDLNTAYIIGGTTVVSDNLLNEINSITKQNISGNRLGGLTRYETNAKVIEKFYPSFVEKVYITEGIELADALTTGPVASLNNSPVVISEEQLVNMQRSVLNTKQTNVIVQVGGIVSRNAINDLRILVSSK